MRRITVSWFATAFALALIAGVGCKEVSAAPPVASSPAFPLAVVKEVELPGASNRWDYQDVDAAHGHLVIAHMNDASVVIAKLDDGSVVKALPNIPTPRGIAVGEDRIFVTSSPSTLVLVDATTLNEIARVPTGNAPDGVAYDPKDGVVGVSAQHDGAVTLLADKGSGKRTDVPLGRETGNVVFDASRRVFWAAVESASLPDQLAAIDPTAAKVTERIPLPGCHGAHGLRTHPDGQSAYVACEEDDAIARVDLGGAHAVVMAKTGGGPDVLAIDSAMGFLYVAAESGDLTVFDLSKPGLVLLDREHVGDHAHSVAVDPATHHVFFPLLKGAHGKPALRIFAPRRSP